MIAAGFALLAAVAALVTPTGGPIARQAGVCPNANGVTVVVDFQELGGGVNVVCATGPVESGLEALRAAGVSYQTAQRFPGFVCRVAGLPANDPCVNTSPASAYWAYWIAAPGGSWCYSTFGAGSRRPAPGTFEGWSFALDRAASELPPPRFDPPAAPAGSAPITLNTSDCTSTPQPPPSVAPTSVAPTTAATTAPPTTTAPPPAPTTATEPALTSSTIALTSSETTAVETTVATTDPQSTAADNEDVAAGSVDLGEDGDGGGSAIGFVASAAVVVGLGTAAALIARRHRMRGGA